MRTREQIQNEINQLMGNRTFAPSEVKPVDAWFQKLRQLLAEWAEADAASTDPTARDVLIELVESIKSYRKAKGSPMRSLVERAKQRKENAFDTAKKFLEG